MNIPKEFLLLAKDFGIAPDVATQLYIRKVSRVSLTDLIWTSERDGLQGAAKKFQSVWQKWSDADGEMFAQAPTKINRKTNPLTVAMAENTFLSQAVRGLEQRIGPLNKVMAPTRTSRATKKIAICADFHGIFCSQPALQRLLLEDADEVHVLGDLTDMYSLSRYRKEWDNISVNEEMAYARAILEKLAGRFGTVKLLRDSNHDVRAKKIAQARCPEILPLVVHPLDVLSAGLSNVEILGTRTKGMAPDISGGQEMEIGYCAQDNDRVYGHFDNFYGADAGVQLDQWLGDFAGLLNLDKAQVVIQAHTHKMRCDFGPKTGKRIILPGAMCRPMPYLVENHGKFKLPNVGYITLSETNGVTDLESIRFVHVGF